MSATESPARDRLDKESRFSVVKADSLTRVCAALLQAAGVGGRGAIGCRWLRWCQPNRPWLPWSHRHSDLYGVDQDRENRAGRGLDHRKGIPGLRLSR